MTAWTKLLTDTYKKNHKKNPSYKFKNAMKDAAKIYQKKQGGSTSKNNKSRKNRGTRKTRK